MIARSISVLVPTRNRPDRVRRLLASFAATADPSAELVFRLDEDDTVSAMLCAGHPMVIGPRYDGYVSLPRFFEEARQIARGDLLMCGNDDMVFQTRGWPARLYAHANQYPDGVFVLGVETYKAHYFPFSIVSRRAIDTMGRLYPLDIFWGDIYLRDVMAAFGRAIRITDVQIDHEWAGFDATDQTFREAHQSKRGQWTASYRALHDQRVQDAIARLEAA